MTIITPTFAQKTNGADHSPPQVFMPYSPPAPQPVPQPAAAPATCFGPKIACIGTAPSSRMLAPYNDPSWKIWACSPGNQGVLPRVDAWFEIHANLLWPECEHYGRPYIEFLKKLTIPVYMQDNSLVPTALSYPMRQMQAEFGPYFFTSSFTWMMAFAIMNGAKEVALYGIDMASRDEYVQQRAGGQYFIVEGARRGVKVWAPYESDIMQPPGLYGYSDARPLGRKTLSREKEIKDRLAQMIPQRDQLNHQITYLQGAAEDVDYFKSIHMGSYEFDDAQSWLASLREKANAEPVHPERMLPPQDQVMQPVVPVEAKDKEH